MEAIIFDVDGTLWDSTEEVAVAWNAAIRDYSDLDIVLTGERLVSEFGKPMDAIMESLFPELTRKEQDALAAHMYQYENKAMETARCKLYDGLIPTVKDLALRYKLFIVSNCNEGYIEAFLKNTGLEKYIMDFTCPGYTGKLKGENIRIVMERNNITDAVYVGDTQGDADACKTAGIPMIYAAYGFGSVEWDYTAIQTFKELTELDFDNIKK